MNNKTCQNCKKNFVVDAEDVAYYEMMHVPHPTLCPECRLVRRLAVRNERSLHKRTCAKCQKSVLSLYAQDSSYIVYCNSCWWSDDWDPTQFAKEYDPSRSFFEQFNELYQLVPQPALHNLYQTLENSEYANMAGSLKNCYLLFNSDYSESCSYGTEVEHSKECFDNVMMEECELSYDNVNCLKCYEVFCSTDLEACHGVYFSRNLSGCSSCFGCVNLRSKQYHIYNEPYTKEGYEAKLKEIDFKTQKSIAEIKKKVDDLALAYPQKYMHEKQNKDASGDYITNSEDVVSSFVTTGARHCRYCLWMIVKPVNDCWDFTQYGDKAERVYEMIMSGNGLQECMFSYYCLNEVARVQYCVKCYNTSDLFGCVGIRQKQYCILNKEYPKKEYEELKAKIIARMKASGEYGEFFPISISPYGYNETSAQELAPLTKERALAKGYKWRDMEEKAHQPSKSWNELPAIENTTDEILKDTILCRAWDENLEQAQQHNCSKAFRLTLNELNFYKRFSLPLPEKCPNSRHHDRLQRRNPFKLWHRSCVCVQAHPQHDGQCPAEFETAYSPESKQLVYCKECYQAEVL